MDQVDAATSIAQFVPPELASALRRVGASCGVRNIRVFGSVARGEATAASDVDLVVLAPPGWDGRSELEDVVRARLGNDCDVLHLTREQFTRAPKDREPVVAEILRDGVALVGAMPRPSRRKAS